MPRTAIVIGGGVIGTCAALHLQRAGVAVTLIDDAPPTPPASWGNAGHIASEQVEPIASRATLAGAPARLFARGGALDLPVRAIAHWLPFGLRLWRATAPARFAAGKAALGALLADALPAWQRLAAAIGAPEAILENGHFIVWESPATAAAGRAHWAQADIGSTSYCNANTEELAALAAFTRTRIAGAIRFTGSAQIADPTQLATSLAAAFVTAGGIRDTGKATLHRDGACAFVGLGDERRDADLVLLAAGVRSGALLAPLGVKVPMIAERGYHIEADCAGPVLPPVVFEDRSLIVTRFGNRLRAASFVEFNRADALPDARKWARLHQHVGDLGLPLHGDVATWHGSRPTLPDYLPVLGRVPGTVNLVAAFGHNHLGLTLAAVTAERLLAGLSAGTWDARLAPNRFA